MILENQLHVEIESQMFEVLVFDMGAVSKLVVCKNGKAIGSREFSHLTDKGQGVIQYAVKAIVRETGLNFDK